MTRKAAKPLNYFENLKNDWPVLKLHLLEQFDRLTEDDLRYEEGKEEELLTRIQEKLGQTRQETERMLQDIYLNAPKGGSLHPDAQPYTDENADESK